MGCAHGTNPYRIKTHEPIRAHHQGLPCGVSRGIRGKETREKRRWRTARAGRRRGDRGEATTRAVFDSRFEEKPETRASSPRAPLCTPAKRAIPPPLRKRPRRGRASRRRRPRSRSIPPCVPLAPRTRRTSGGAPRRENQKSACRFFSSAQKLRFAPGSLPKRPGRLFIPLPSGSRITHRRRVRVSRRRFVSTPARFSRLRADTFGPRESRHPRRSPCRSPRKGIVRARVRFLTRR